MIMLCQNQVPSKTFHYSHWANKKNPKSNTIISQVWHVTYHSLEHDVTAEIGEQIIFILPDCLPSSSRRTPRHQRPPSSKPRSFNHRLIIPGPLIEFGRSQIGELLPIGFVFCVLTAAGWMVFFCHLRTLYGTKPMSCLMLIASYQPTCSTSKVHIFKR